MNRTEFIKLSCSGCILGAAGLLSLTELLSCTPTIKVFSTTISDKMLTVPLNKIPERDVLIVRAKGMDVDIAIRRLPNSDQLEALLLRCTHFSNPLQATGKGYSCSLHGSQFDTSGKVLKGPAVAALKQLELKNMNDTIWVYL